MSKEYQTRKNPILFSNKNYTDRVCLEPFGTIEIDLKGNVRMCGCASWMQTTIGNIFENTIDEILSSELAVNIRQSIRNGTFSYCNETTCGFISNNWLFHIDDYTEHDNRWRLFKDETLPKYPTTYFISGDTTCNLSCPSCRKHVINNNSETALQNEMALDKLNKQLFNSSATDLINIHLSTSGEAFASPLLLSFLSNFPIDRYPNARFWIQTNGLLVQRRFSNVEHIKSNIVNITITTDSCTEVIYEQLRRGGKFADLHKNLEFIATLGIEFNLRMVVQRDNQHEITEFYHWAKSIGATHVEYTRIQNWGTYTPSQFSEIDVLNHSHNKYIDSIQQLSQLRDTFNDVVFFGFNV